MNGEGYEFEFEKYRLRMQPHNQRLPARLFRGADEVEFKSPLICRLLVYLLEHREQRILNGDVIEHVWQGQPLQDEKRSLTGIVEGLRDLLNDKARPHRFVERGEGEIQFIYRPVLLHNGHPLSQPPGQMDILPKPARLDLAVKDTEPTTSLGVLTTRFSKARPAIRRHIRDYTTLIDDKTAGFVGRRFIVDEFDEFTKSAERGYFFVYGDPGIGKSALAAHLVETRGYVHHFNIQSEGINRAEAFLTNTCAQLIANYDLAHEILPREATSDAGTFNTLLREAVAVRPSTSVVIVIDALDEVDRTGVRPGANLLYLPTILPSGVFILVTTRRIADIPRFDCEYRGSELSHDSKQNLLDIEEYINIRIEGPRLQSYITSRGIRPRDFAELMVHKSEGNFAYLRYVLPEIESGAYKDIDQDFIPAGLQGYYEDHWRRMRAGSGAEWFEYKLPIIAALTVIEEPVSIGLLGELSGVVDRARIQTVLAEWRQFLHEVPIDTGQGKPETRLRFYHSSYYDYLRCKEDVSAEHFDLRGAHERIVSSLWSGFNK